MSIILWAAGYAAGKVRDAAIAKLINQNLDDKLIRVVNSWLTEHGFEKTLPEALFNWESSEITDLQPQRKKIAEEMNHSHIPTADLWFGALSERFVEIQTKFPDPEDRQPLFRRDLSSISGALHELAQLLTETCSKDETFFKVSVYAIVQEFSEFIKREKTVQDILKDLADYLNNKRVLYQTFIREERNPVLPLILAAESIRAKMIDEIVPKLSRYEETRKHARKMAQACVNFDDTLAELPLKIRRDGNTSISELQPEYMELVEKALLRFRTEFTGPMITMLTEHMVSIPENILKTTPLASMSVPDKIYVEGLPVLSKSYLYYAGYEAIGYFLRIINLAESLKIDGIEFPKGTELIFYDPKTTNGVKKVWKAELGENLEINCKTYAKGTPVYFDIQGNASIDPVKELD
jgi:hypothetical protein